VKRASGFPASNGALVDARLLVPHGDHWLQRKSAVERTTPNETGSCVSAQVGRRWLPFHYVYGAKLSKHFDRPLPVSFAPGWIGGPFHGMGQSDAFWHLHSQYVRSPEVSRDENPSAPKLAAVSRKMSRRRKESHRKWSTPRAKVTPVQ
jgi:hypothetical protein